MSRITEARAWVTPFEDAAQGVTSAALNAAVQAFDDAPEEVRGFVIREGLRALLHNSRRTAAIRVNGDADTLPLFVALDEAGVVVHKPRPEVAVGSIETIIGHWSRRQAEASRELTWWVHQRDLAEQASAADDETLRHVWNRLGLNYQLFIGAPDEEVA